MRTQLRIVFGALLLLTFSASAVVAQTGKIAGQVTDAETGEPLPGVNVLIEGEQIGATTNQNGRYSIVGLQPGTYTLRASFVGFADQVVEDIQVNIDLTTSVDFELQEETQELQEVTVQASEPVVKPDVSANVANLETADFENIPVAGVEEVINLQAGIEPGMSIRGGSRDQLNFVVDGMSMRTGRRNEPFTGISYTSVQEVQVQTGGFSAQYGNVRSGLINVVTKDAPRDRYLVDAFVRYQPAQAKSLGGLPSDPDSYYMAPHVPDPDVPADQDAAFVGTEQVWDRYRRRQHPDFVGWNNVAAGLAEDDDPNNDLTPQQLVEVFRWRTRKSNKIEEPDYVADVTVGGPLIPGLSDNLGDLRFLASYRRNQTAYFYPLERPTFLEQTGQLKVTTSLAPSMKLSVKGMLSGQRGMNQDQNLPYVDIAEGNMPVYPWSGVPSILQASDRGRVVFSPNAVNPVDVDHRLGGATFTHTLGANTFYEVNLQRTISHYRSHFPRMRDQTTDAFCIQGNQGQNLRTEGQDANVYCVDEAPYGFAGEGGNITGAGFTTGGHWAKTRDTTDVSYWSGSFDLTSQIDQFNQLKAGADLIYSQYDVHFERRNLALAFNDFDTDWSREPIQGAAYVEDKLEFEGLIANVGLRFDYFDANAQWWIASPYANAFRGDASTLDQQLDKTSVDPQFTLSPRLGVSFPVTTDSKVYFNYGHFRQMLDPRNLFEIQSSDAGGINDFGNPLHPMPQTVAYELGYDQNLLDMFLIRVSGYYRDTRKQPRSVSFSNLDQSITYSTFFPWNYQDVRGAEFTVSKTQGQWIRGFLNYSYMSTKSGNLGFAQFFENAFDQRAYLRNSTDYRVFAPVSQPFARLSLDLFTPVDFGPELGGLQPLSNWRMNFLGRWREGTTFTWEGGAGSYPSIQNNISWRDYFNVDVRIEKTVGVGPGAEVQLFADMSNVFNFRHVFRNTAFLGSRDFFYYMRSLHLPEDTFEEIEEPPYQFIHGDDQPGDFREPGVAYQPVEVVPRLGDVTEDQAASTTRAYYYSKEQGDYFQWDPGSSSWTPVDDAEIERMKETRAYIDMPNATWATFLNPRMVKFGLRFSF